MSGRRRGPATGPSALGAGLFELTSGPPFKIGSRRGAGGGRDGSSAAPLVLKSILLSVVVLLAGLMVKLNPHNLDISTHSGHHMEVVRQTEGDGVKDAPLEEDKRRTSEEEVPQSAKEDRKLFGRDGKMYVRQRFLAHLAKLKPFPRKLHVLFPDADYYKKEPGVSIPFVKHSMLRFIDMNPMWEVIVHDDDDMDGIIKRAANDEIISWEERNLLVGNETTPAAHPVERADIARMLYMWYFGGLYVDADALVNPKGFDNVFGSTVKMCLPIYLETNFAQSISCSSPKNQLYMHVIKSMSQYRMASNDGRPIERRGGWAKREHLFSMGPPMWNRIVFQRVFGEDPKIKRNGEIEGMEARMNLLQEVAGDLIATGQYKDGCHSFIAEHYEGCEELNRHQLYQAYNMTGWGNAVKERWASDATS
ncbi:hypothetical protein ACHAXT_006086 [Thalassiosira profunda]